MLSLGLRIQSEQAAVLDSGWPLPAASMSSFLPSLFQRSWILCRARRALLEDECERALELLAHPALALSPSAERLRRRVLERLWRVASRKSRSGRTGSVARLIDLVAREDPGSADDWSRRLLPAVQPAVPSAELAAGADPPSQAARLIGRLLEELQTRVQSVEPGESSESRPSPARGVPSDSAGSPPTRSEGPPHFHLAIDDAGEFLVACKPSLVLGHSRGGRADLPFFSDLESAHARLFLEESFHGGPRWVLEELVEQAFVVRGVEPETKRRTLENEDEVRVGSNLEFRFLAPDPSSSSAILELLHGAECEGAARVLLFGEGEAGRVRMGGRMSRHFAVPGLEEDVTLTREGTDLRVVSEGSYRSTPDLPLGGDATTDLLMPCPPSVRVSFVGAPRGQNPPPFSFSIAPGEAR